MKILLTGAEGQLGHELGLTLPTGWELHPHSRHTLDISSAEMVAEVLAHDAPDLVINAAAYTAVDRAEEESAQAYIVNRDGAANVARACADRGVRMIHVSTDFVFDGGASQPYTPDASPSPLGEYARSKLAGEHEVIQQAGENALVVRTSWVYSRFGQNFVKTMLRLMAQREEVSVVSDQLGSPTWARRLAQVLWGLAAQSQLSGVWHYSDTGVISWHDFACAIAELGRECGLLNRDVQVNAIATSDYPTAAARPAYSALDSSATLATLGFEATPWRQNLEHMLADMKEQEVDYLD